LIGYAIFSMGYLSNGGRKRNKIWHRGSIGDKDDARISNTHTAQRKYVIPRSTMKTNCNIIECCNNTYQGAPLTRKQTIHTGQYSTILFTQNMHVELKIVTSNPQVMRKLTEVAKTCCACNTSPKLALRTSVTAVTLLVAVVVIVMVMVMTAAAASCLLSVGLVLVGIHTAVVQNISLWRLTGCCCMLCSWLAVSSKKH